MAVNGRGRPEITAAIIDDHDVVHAGIEAWCAQANPPIALIAKFRYPREFFAAAHQLKRIDVVLLDPQVNGGRFDFAALRMLCRAGQRVVIYSHIATDEIILTSLELGALTYLVKSEGKHHLIEAIHAAGSAAPYLGPRMARALLNDRTCGRTKLSEREKEVLRAWFQTESKELVAQRLHIASTTVRTHLQRARAKYALVGRPASTKSALLARAIEDGILSLDEL
jgi:DNA-binding NarL/FixJ family response regulator